MISESQLDTWSKQGSVTGSSDTYNSIKNVLESSTAPYSGRLFKVFLQGSYGNDTNIYAESDVDIVIQNTGSFHYDLTKLSAEDKAAFEAAYSGGSSYKTSDFKTDVIAHLTKNYGSSVTVGNKAVEIAANNNRRKVDVIICSDFRDYYEFKSTLDQRYDEGICLFDSNWNRIVNYPKKHSANCTTKHQATNSWYKPTVRIFKNLRNKLISEDLIKAGDAPSYFIEGMLWNVPNSMFGSNYSATVENCLNWLQLCDRGKLVCANDKYYLLHDTSLVTWRKEKFEAFITAAMKLSQKSKAYA